MGYDLIIRGCIIVDGTGAPPFKSDIGIKGDTIVAVKDLSGEKAEQVIDVDGLYAPFISKGYSICNCKWSCHAI
ncbi:TPA: hypothetical protein EYP83_02910 [Candidatus Geothermarchaeota archaeon]|nr:hypothetical protein [Candidatus Geothermarchaeota archaeon]